MKIHILFLFTLFSFSLFAQNTGSLNGRIIDSQSEQPLEGASVILKGTSVGVVTDEDHILLLKTSQH